MVPHSVVIMYHSFVVLSTPLLYFPIRFPGPMSSPSQTKIYFASTRCVLVSSQLLSLFQHIGAVLEADEFRLWPQIDRQNLLAYIARSFPHTNSIHKFDVQVAVDSL